MPEISNYTFELRELTELLVKAAGVKDGHWGLNVNITFTAGNFQNAPNSALPGSMTVIQNVGISKVDPATSPPNLPPNLTVDAAALLGKAKK